MNAIQERNLIVFGYPAFLVIEIAMTVSNSKETAARRAKMFEHLEAALALADKPADATAGYMIEQAINALRVLEWQDSAL